MEKSLTSTPGGNQDDNANFRTRLVEYVSAYNPNFTEIGQLTQQHLAMLSAEGDRQATLLTCRHLFIGLKAVSLVAATIVSVQRWMK
jgi:hypothetical protein